MLVAGIAARQSGAVSSEQLRDAGLGDGGIELRVRRRRLRPIHRGVYAVGPADLSFRGTLWAAVLACGGPRVTIVSWWSALAVWELSAGGGTAVHVTTLGESRSRTGIRVHRSRRVPAFVVQDDGLAVATPSQTIVDLASHLSRARLAQLCHRAEQRRLLDATVLQRALARRVPGATRLRSVLAELADTGPQIARNEFETLFLELMERHGLPRPEVNARLGVYEPDFLWGDARVIVELDGAESHFTPAAFQADRRRHVALQLAGWRVLRFTWRQLTEEPGYVARAVRALAGLRTAAGASRAAATP